MINNFWSDEKCGGELVKKRFIVYFVSVCIVIGCEGKIGKMVLWIVYK